MMTLSGISLPHPLLMFSQTTARRNAAHAINVLGQRRADRQKRDGFLADLDARRRSTGGEATRAAPSPPRATAPGPRSASTSSTSSGSAPQPVPHRPAPPREWSRNEVTRCSHAVGAVLCAWPAPGTVQVRTAPGCAPRMKAAACASSGTVPAVTSRNAVGSGRASRHRHGVPQGRRLRRVAQQVGEPVGDRVDALLHVCRGRRTP